MRHPDLHNWHKPKALALLNPSEVREIRIALKKHRVKIGIDPGVQTGLAISVNKKLVLVETRKIHEALDTVRVWVSGYSLIDTLVRVEDARLRKYLPKEKSSSEYRGKLMGAGSVKRDCKIWEDFLSDLGVDFELLPPRAGTTKWSEAYFQKITGWTRKTTNHGRDAAASIIGL